jgi:hypothetical protein
MNKEMTEQDWLAGPDLDSMIGFLFCLHGGKSSERKQRLFACACARRVWHLLDDPRSRSAIQVAERSVDGLAGEAEIAAAIAGISSAVTVALADYGERSFEHYAAACLVHIFDFAPEVASRAISLVAEAGRPVVIRSFGYNKRSRRATEQERPIQAALLSDLFGNPFRPVSIDRAWLSPTVLQLAHAAYDRRILPIGHLEPARLAVLSDALEEAGCSNVDLLAHLRAPGPHYRGCWAVDGLLQRS